MNGYLSLILLTTDYWLLATIPKGGYMKLLFSLLITLIFTYPCFAQDNNCPVTIFYGLNESHSNDWAQVTSDGQVIISYYDKLTQNLICKTIQPEGTETEEIIASGPHLEISVLLLDSAQNPHIFVASSDSFDQTISHYYKNSDNQWEHTTIMNFLNEGGAFIYELSADLDSNGSFHLLVLKTPSNPDSEDYYYAFADAHLYYLTNASGEWQRDLIRRYNTYWTLDEYAKTFNRQDIKIDSNNNVHIIFGEQINAMNYSSPSRLNYTNNISGNWEIEVAADYNTGTRDDGGWFPSLALDNNDTPCIAYCYIGRVGSGSAHSARLMFAKRTAPGTWDADTVATSDAGYYGSDGRDYTGALTHLVFDTNNVPHIAFADIASSHAGQNYFNLGNVRFAVKNNNNWDISTIYEQPLPNGFFNATEMYGMCLLISEDNTINVLGQEITVRNSDDYDLDFVHVRIEPQDVNDNLQPNQPQFTNYPNPFNPSTTFSYNLKEDCHITLEIYNLKGQKIRSIISDYKSNGGHTVTWNGKNDAGKPATSGIYFAKLKTDRGDVKVKKCLLLK